MSSSLTAYLDERPAICAAALSMPCLAWGRAVREASTVPTAVTGHDLRAAWLRLRRGRTSQLTT